MDPEEDYNTFLKLYKDILTSSGVPEIFWKALCQKLNNEDFDSGKTFLLTRFEYDEEDDRDLTEPIFQLQINTSDGISADDPTQIYLVDHAFTFTYEQAKIILSNDQVGSLLERLSTMMGINQNLPKEELVDAIFNESWKFANTYSVANDEDERLAYWYIMDEVGSAMKHSLDPNFRMVPFHYLDNVTYSLIFPIKDCEFADVITRNFLERTEGDPDEIKALNIPWKPQDLSKLSFKHVNITPDYFLSGHITESLPILKNFDFQRNMLEGSKLKVFAEYKFIHEYLTDKSFQLVDNEQEADILWYTSHFKTFEELSKESPTKFINQFPFEYVLTVKDLICIVSRMKNREDYINMETLNMEPKWLPVTYNLKTEITQFVSYFQNREAKNLDNHWIIKPFNLARGMDTHITNNLNCILRMPSTGPKIAQKYIHNPVLFTRPGIGKVKFDVRYVILLKTVNPLEVYIYKKFFLRFANQAFSLSDLHVYEKHFTVMNYNKKAELKHMLCSEFKDQWMEQFEVSWNVVEAAIGKMLKEVFECATTEPPPCGISENPQSRALYAADIMLEEEINEENDVEIIPKLLEINWMPDCKRACEYYPDFYNDIFKLLFLDIENESVFNKL